MVFVTIQSWTPLHAPLFWEPALPIGRWVLVRRKEPSMELYVEKNYQR